MMARLLIVYLVISIIAFLSLRAQNNRLRSAIVVSQVTEPASSHSIADPTTAFEVATEETAEPASVEDFTAPIIVPTTITEMATGLAELYTLGLSLDKIDSDAADMTHPKVQQFVRMLPVMIGAFDVHEPALKTPDGYGEFMAVFIGSVLEVEDHKISTLEELYREHRVEAIELSLVGGGPSKESGAERSAWLKKRAAFVEAYRETVRNQVGADLDDIPYGWSVTAPVEEMKRVLNM